MEFGTSLTRSRNRNANVILTPKSYPCSIQMYTTPPDGNVSLSEFDEMAVERLKILRSIERHNLSGPIRGSTEWVDKIYEDFRKNKNFIVSSEGKSDFVARKVEEARRQDHISHFILRLAYCRTEELRRWFIAQEVDLFRARFIHTANNKADIITFMKDNNMYFSPISDKEFEEERTNLMDGTYKIGGSGDKLEGRTFYKVHFTEALELIKGRKVFLKAGFAYVPDTELVTLISFVYRTHLSKALAHTCRALPQLEDDDRLLRLLQDFDRRYTGSDYTNKKTTGTTITPAMLDTLASKAFPLCMRKLHETLVNTHHLKHGGRMQYGLFLKAAGLSLEDALHFWRSHFTKNMDVDKFDKQYAYNIRHNYGKEGKRTEYSPYSCIKIITGNVGPGDAHGCPFKVTDGPVLKQRLIAYGLQSSVVNDIADLSNKGHYQIACQKYWEATHKTTLEAGINHPNQYLEESRKHSADGPKTATPTAALRPDVPTRRSVLHASSQSSQVTSSTNSSSSQQDNNDTTAVDDYFDDDDMDADFSEIDATIERHEAEAAKQKSS